MNKAFGASFDNPMNRPFDAFDWTALEAPLAEIRHHYCDAFMDGQAGKRAAQEIDSLVKAPQPLITNTLLHSLQKKKVLAAVNFIHRPAW